MRLVGITLTAMSSTACAVRTPGDLATRRCIEHVIFEVATELAAIGERRPTKPASRPWKLARVDRVHSDPAGSIEAPCQLFRRAWWIGGGRGLFVGDCSTWTGSVPHISWCVYNGIVVLP